MSLTHKMAAAGRGPTAGRPGQYQGDPGLFGSIVGGIGGFLTGGPAGAIAGAVGGWKSGRSSQPPQLPSLPRFGPGSVPVTRVPGPAGVIQRLAPGGRTGYQVQASPNGGPPKGYRLNKTGYHLKDGTYVAPGSKWVKIRRRNPLNPRAASRAISRLESAKKAVKRLNRVTIRKAASCR